MVNDKCGIRYGSHHSSCIIHHSIKVDIFSKCFRVGILICFVGQLFAEQFLSNFDSHLTSLIFQGNQRCHLLILNILNSAFHFAFVLRVCAFFCLRNNFFFGLFRFFQNGRTLFTGLRQQYFVLACRCDISSRARFLASSREL